MQALGIPTAVHYPQALHQQPAYRALGADASYPVSEYLAARVISLPMSADLEQTHLLRVVQALAQATNS